MSERMLKTLVFGGLGLLAFIIAAFILADFVNIEGYEVGVVHKWSSGVQDEPLRNGMHWVWCAKVHPINIGTQKITFAPQIAGDKEGKDTKDNEFDVIQVACGKEGGQKVNIVLTVVYHLDAIKAVQLYRDNLSETYRYTIMKRTIIDVVNQLARPREALDIYSGEGFNDLKIAVDKAIKDHPVLVDRGIVCENATIYDVKLDPSYESEIELKQLAKQQKLRAFEQALAAVEEAKRAKAKAQVMVEERTAEADAKKIEVTTAAEANKQQVVLAAEAQKETDRLKGEGEKAMMIAQAEGERALGLAQAEVEKAKRDAMYEGEPGGRRAQVEISKAQAELAKGILSGVKVIPNDILSAMLQEWIGSAKEAIPSIVPAKP